MAGPPVAYVADEHFACSSCGVCCTQWSIPLSNEEAEKLSAVDWAAVDPVFAGRELFRGDAGAQPITLRMGAADERCLFLDGENQCHVHRTVPWEDKPLTCRTFPYIFHATPAGVMVLASWASTAVILGEGPHLRDQREQLEPLLAENLARRKVTKSDERLPFPSIDAVQAYLRDEGTAPIEQRMIALREVLTELEPGVASIPAPEVLTEQLRAKLAITGEKLPTEPGRTGFFSRLLAFYITMLVRPGAGRWAAIWAAITRRLILPGIDGVVRLSAFSAVAWGEDAEQVALWRRFAAHLLLRAFIRPPVHLHRYATDILTNLAFARWLAKLSAAAKGHSRVEIEDAVWAVRETSRKISTHSPRSAQILARASGHLATFYDDPKFLQAFLLANP